MNHVQVLLGLDGIENSFRFFAKFWEFLEGGTCGVRLSTINDKVDHLSLGKLILRINLKHRTKFE